MPEIKISDDSWSLSSKNGNGILRREVWVNAKGKVVRYNLAYMNHKIFQGDNGRVVGYDNAHGYHHRHLMGVVEPVEFKSFEEIEEQFQADWVALRSKK
ncbi:MAG: transcriptional regulator [Sideroxydans sp.]|nr:transcriptional regulator [Sideroxydans sp.]